MRQRTHARGPLPSCEQLSSFLLVCSAPPPPALAAAAGVPAIAAAPAAAAHLAREAPRAQQRRVEHLGAVGGCQQQHARAPLKPVQLCQQLVQRLVALLVQTHAAAAAWAAGGRALGQSSSEGRPQRARVTCRQPTNNQRAARAQGHGGSGAPRSPTASSSSIKMTQGEALRASANSSLRGGSSGREVHGRGQNHALFRSNDDDAGPCST